MRLSILLTGLFVVNCWGRPLAPTCDEILANGPAHSIEEINRCSLEKLGVWKPAPLPNVVCPDLEQCSRQCIFGWRRNDTTGCLTCQCEIEGKEGLYQGDIILTKGIRQYLKHNLDLGPDSSEAHLSPGEVGLSPPAVRGAARNVPLWKMYQSGTTYQVPYVISSSIGATGVSAIRQAASDFAQHSCIRLVPRTAGRSKYISFYRGGGCSSPVGAQGVNRVSLASGCWDKGTVIHEVLHSLGFWHEQSRPDRDRFVRINYNNIPQNVRYNFNKFTTTQINSLNSRYDVRSVMHYGSFAFSVNRRPTITDLRGNVLNTQRDAFSSSDIAQLNRLYGCSGGGGGGGGGGSCQDTNTNCAYWAGIGECNRNPDWMRPNCCESCNAGEDCEDDNTSCPGWAQLGFCTGRYEAYMTKNCKKSCDVC